MAKFKIEVQEISQKILEVEAADELEAIAVVVNDYQNGGIELTPEDLKETVVRKYASCEQWYGKAPSVKLL